MVKFSSLLAAIGFLTADAFRSEVKSHAVVDDASNDTSSWNFAGVQLNPDPNGPLISNLVPPPGHTFEVQNRERLDFLESNEYRWAFISIQTPDQVTLPVNTWFATLQGGFFSNLFGARRTEITNNFGAPLFAIELSKYQWNPTRLSWSFRIRHSITNEILYTINKDWIGAGFLFLRDEWRVYRGRRRDGNQIYHVIGGYFGYGHRYYHNKREWRRGVDPCAEASQSMGRDFLGLPDVYSLKVHENEDTALLLATTVIIDMVHESEAAARERERERERREREAQSSSMLQVGSDESVWSEEAMARAEAEKASQ